MPMPEAMKNKMRAFTAQLSKQIQDINGDPKLAGHEKKAAIEKLSGAPKEDMYEFLNRNFRTGPGLHGNLKHLVTEGRPRGAPKDSAKGTKPKNNK